ncbi:MAG: type II secretion system protein M [Burkholderiaceae bacterium]|nr:type II secretion system protein M [Burkholderiaceae bacterium]
MAQRSYPGLEQAFEKWRSLAPRERRLIVAALAIVFVAVVYLMFFEPAWKGRTSLLRDLPGMRAQLAKMESLALEARDLGAVPDRLQSQSAIRGQLERSLQAAGLQALATIEVRGDRIELRFARVGFGAWLDWLELAIRETRARVVDLSANRDPSPGFVAVRMAIELPGAGKP